MIVPGSSSQLLAAALADATGRTLKAVTYDRFPDGETLATVPPFEGATATIVATTDTDRAWVELLQLQDAVREAGAEHVTTVIPYMGYARQDESFRAGQPISARAMARAISTGTDRVVLINPHEPAVADFYDVPVETVDAAATLAAPLESLADPLFLAPDAGATAIAETVRDTYGDGETGHFEKHVLTARGAERVVAACVHPVLVGNATTKLRAAGVDRIISTDTVERGCSVVSAAPALKTALEAERADAS